MGAKYGLFDGKKSTNVRRQSAPGNIWA